MLNSKKWVASLLGIALMSVGTMAHAAQSAFPPAPSGTPVAGVVGLGLLAAGALAIGVRQATRK